jgi:acetyl-CoA carboxylase biotin carboxyl carrier protein
VARTPKNSDESAGTSSGMATNPKIDHDLIRELAKLLDETGLTEIEYEQSGSRVRVARQPAAVTTVAPARPAAPEPISTPIAGSIDPSKHPGVVTSPMVGTAYMAPEPGARPFVEVGSVVRTASRSNTASH